MSDRQDSMWNAMSTQLIERTEALAANSVDSMAKAVGLMVMDRSRIVYSPHINVQPDTVAAARYDTLIDQMRLFQMQMAQLSARMTKNRKNEAQPKGPWNY
jgi:hypothetical protein